MAAGVAGAVVILDVAVTCELSLPSNGEYLEGDGATNRVEMNNFPPVGVNLQALLRIL